MYDYSDTQTMERMPDKQQLGNKDRHQVNAVIGDETRNRDQSCRKQENGEQELHDTMYMLEYF